MYSPEKLNKLEAMDNETFQYYFKNGPKPKWTREQWEELREYQGTTRISARMQLPEVSIRFYGPEVFLLEYLV